MRDDCVIICEKYLSKIRPFYDVDLIKIITGIRRCEKSVILTQIIDELKNNSVDDKDIIYLNFESKQNSFIKMIIILNMLFQRILLIYHKMV